MQTILTTQDVKEHERFDFWREAICDVFVQLDASQLSTDTFSGILKNGWMKEIQISEVIADSQEVIRSPRQIQKASEDFFLISLQLEGTGYIEQNNRIAALAPGDFTMYDSTRPYTLYFSHSFKQLVFQFPRSLLFERLPSAEEMTAILLPGNRHQISSTVSSLLHTISSSYLYLDSRAQLRMNDTLLDLLSVVLSSVTNTNLEGLHSRADIYRLHAKSFIYKHLANPNLTPTLIAFHLGISERYLHKLFESEEASVASFIRNKRLEQCKNDLVHPKFRHASIIDIALRWGFNNAAHFSRIFKDRYGMSPSSFRKLNDSDSCE